MFGPDICGSTKKVHVILTYKNTNYLIEKQIKAESDESTHVYTLVIHPDQSYEVLVDQKEVASGKIEEDWKILAPRKIKDPKASKPASWDDRAKIADPNDVKPAVSSPPLSLFPFVFRFSFSFFLLLFLLSSHFWMGTDE